MKAKFVPFEVEHVERFEALDIYEKHPYKEIYRNVHEHPDVYLHTLLDSTDCPIAIMGFVKIFPRVASVWCVTGKEAIKYPKTFARACRGLIKAYFANKTVDRAEVYIRCDQPWAIKWGHLLGFELEGVCKKYGFEQVDHFLMAKVV